MISIEDFCTPGIARLNLQIAREISQLERNWEITAELMSYLQTMKEFKGEPRDKGESGAKGDKDDPGIPQSSQLELLPNK